MDDSVKRYLDILMPLKDLADKGSDLSKSGDHIKDFSESILNNPANDKKDQDVVVDEATLMEGFRYRVDDSKFPVFKSKDQLNNKEFPIIPVGMLDIWRADNEVGEELDF